MCTFQLLLRSPLLRILQVHRSTNRNVAKMYVFPDGVTTNRRLVQTKISPGHVENLCINDVTKHARFAILWNGRIIFIITVTGKND
jgi:hypothetical protein